MVWALPRPWSETMVSRRISRVWSALFGFGLADPAPKGYKNGTTVPKTGTRGTKKSNDGTGKRGKGTFAKTTLLQNRPLFALEQRRKHKKDRVFPLVRRRWRTGLPKYLGVSQRPLTLILSQKYRDTNGRRIVIQIGGVYTTSCHREGIHLQKYAIEMGGVSRYFFACIGVRGRFDSPELYCSPDPGPSKETADFGAGVKKETLRCVFSGEHSGDHNHQDFPKVLRYKWEAYCDTNGRRTAIQMGGVLTVFLFLRA